MSKMKLFNFLRKYKSLVSQTRIRNSMFEKLFFPSGYKKLFLFEKLVFVDKCKIIFHGNIKRLFFGCEKCSG